MYIAGHKSPFSPIASSLADLQRQHQTRKRADGRAIRQTDSHPMQRSPCPGTISSSCGFPKSGEMFLSPAAGSPVVS